MEEEKKKDDEEITLDFSKVKNFFKQATKESDTTAQAQNEDEEIKFDFSKIKNIFKRKKQPKDSFVKPAYESQKSPDEVEFNFSSFTSFLRKYQVVFLLLIPIILAIFLRTMPWGIPVTDDWAQNSVYDNIKQQMSATVRSQYPNLPSSNIDTITNTQFNEFLKTNKAQIDQQVQQVSAYFKKDFQRENGKVYPGDLDPYFWLYHARNILNNGHPGDTLMSLSTNTPCLERSSDCVPWDSLMYAPLGRPVPPDMFHSYAIAYIHKIASIVNPDQDLYDTLLLIPVILAVLCVIPAFFIARRLGGNLGGFIAAIFIVIHPSFLTRTLNSADTDAYNVLFPLIITWFFLMAFEAKNWRMSVIYSSISALFIAIYTIVWPGWWYIFDFLLASLALYIGIYLINHRKDLKNIWKKWAIRRSIIVLFAFFTITFLATAVIKDVPSFTAAFPGPMAFAKLKEVGIDTVWPNVFTTVAEQNSASLSQVIEQTGTGGPLRLIIFILGLSGILFAMVKKNPGLEDYLFLASGIIWYAIIIGVKDSIQSLSVFLFLLSIPVIFKIGWSMYKNDEETDFKLAVILIIWLLATIYASIRGIRFMLLLAPVFSISIGIAFGVIYRILSKSINKYLYLNINLSRVIIAILLMAILIQPLQFAQGVAKQSVPLINDAWYNSLTSISENAEPKAIINSWWDYGHWFKAVGKRAVTFDGTSQNSPMAHWIGLALLTNDEDQSVGILRMLDCGSNTAFNKLDKEINDTAKSVNILHNEVRLEKKEALSLLKTYVSDKTANEVIEYTHCDAPEDYFITSEDMIGKSGVWAHFGSWDFDKALIYNTLKKESYAKDKDKSIEFIMQRFNYSKENANRLYSEVLGITTSEAANSWIAPWPSFASGPISCSKEINDSIICPLPVNQGGVGNIQVKVNRKKNEATVIGPAGLNYPLVSVVYPKKDRLITLNMNATQGVSMTLIPEGDNWFHVMTVPPLADSMFVRLYYMGGHGLTHFEKSTEERSVVGTRVVVWKVDWEGKQSITLPFF